MRQPQDMEKVQPIDRRQSNQGAEQLTLKFFIS